MVSLKELVSSRTSIRSNIMHVKTSSLKHISLIIFLNEHDSSTLCSKSTNLDEFCSRDQNITGLLWIFYYDCNNNNRQSYKLGKINLTD